MSRDVEPEELEIFAKYFDNYYPYKYPNSGLAVKSKIAIF
jgi:hypothetical protein